MTAHRPCIQNTPRPQPASPPGAVDAADRQPDSRNFSEKPTAWSMRLALCMPVLLLSACQSLSQHTQIHTDDQRLAAVAQDLPSRYPAQPHSDAAVLGSQWWQAFGDPVLNQYVNEALDRNPNRLLAALRVQTAQQQAELTGISRRPEWNASANASANRALQKDSSTNRSFGLSAQVSYILDLWGKLANQQRAADVEVNATEQDQQAATLAVVGQVIDQYWRIGALNQQIATARQSLGTAQNTQRIVSVQYRYGKVSGIEQAEAQQSVASQQGSLTRLIQQRDAARIALSILLDHPLQALPAEPQTLPSQSLPAINAGLPASLLSRRPDLRAAELRLQKALIQTDVVRASFYPSITLTGSLGTSSTALLEMLKNPVAALGAGITLPFLQQAKLQRQLRVSELEYEQALAGFRQALITALQEVADALSTRASLQTQLMAQQSNLEASQRTEHLYALRYKQGAVDLRTYLQAQESRRQAESTLLQLRLQQLQNQLTLYQALGGGF